MTFYESFENILGLPRLPIVLSDTESDDEDFKKPKKKGHKITFSDDDEDDNFSLSPKPSTSKGKI